MKLASLRNSKLSSGQWDRTGQLVVVSRDNQFAVSVHHIAPTLLSALESWIETAPKLRAVSDQLNSGEHPEAFLLDPTRCLAPLPTAPGFYDGSAFLSHVVRARRARGDQMPESAKKTPLMYQGVSDHLRAPYSPIELGDPSFGGDFEGEFAVIVSDVPRACPADDATKYIAVIVMFNDITFRELVKTEIETKFGFLQSKPNSSFAPFAVTPDELGAAWRDGRVQLDLEVQWNGKPFGRPAGNEMHFSFEELIAHACRTRPLSAGSIIGSGTVSNEDQKRGFACLTEQRFQEILDTGKASTPWLKAGDRVFMDVRLDGVSVFGSIDQSVKN